MYVAWALQLLRNLQIPSITSRHKLQLLVHTLLHLSSLPRTTCKRVQNTTYTPPSPNFLVGKPYNPLLQSLSTKQPLRCPGFEVIAENSAVGASRNDNAFPCTPALPRLPFRNLTSQHLPNHRNIIPASGR